MLHGIDHPDKACFAFFGSDIFNSIILVVLKVKLAGGTMQEQQRLLIVKIVRNVTDLARVM